MTVGERHSNRAFVDLHVHSTCSVDGASSIVEHARRASALGLAEIGFCEHQDLDRRDQGYLYLDPERCHREIAAAQAAVPDVRLRQGVEITYQASLETECHDWLAGWSWDYVVASVHLMDYADDWAIISEAKKSERYFRTHSQRQSYLPYFEELLRAARSKLGDVLGHFDLVKRYGVNYYGPFRPTVFEEEIRAVLRTAVESGVGLEINTSGLRQSPAEPYPTLTVLRWYRELRGDLLTVGSDAHHVDDLGAGIAQALELARAAGFGAVVTFEGRKPQWLDL
jgi:histidinol-phosphatase (PHP family)